MHIVPPPTHTHEVHTHTHRHTNKHAIEWEHMYDSIHIPHTLRTECE